MGNILSRLRDFVFHPGYVREMEAQQKLVAFEDMQPSTEVIIDDLMPANRTNPPRAGMSAVLNSYEQVPRLRAVVERIADSVAQMPWEAWYTTRSSTDRGARHLPKMALRSKKALDKYHAKAATNGNLIVLAEHPILELLERGNPFLDGYQIEKLSSIYSDTAGEWLEMIEFSDKTNLPQHLWPIPPQWVYDTPKDNYPYFKVNFNGQFLEIPASRVIWCKNPRPLNPYRRGTGMATTLGDEIDTDEYAARVVKAAFLNNNLPASIVVFPGMTPDQYSTQERKWKARYGSPSKSGMVRFMNAADVKQVRLTPSFKDTQMSEIRKDQRDIILQSFGVPPEILGIVENSNRATIDAADYIMQRYVTGPRKDARRRCYQRQLVVFYDDRLVLDYPCMASQDEDRKIEIMSAAPYNFSRNQWQQAAGLDDLGDEGEVYMVPAGIVQVPAGEDMPTPEEEPTEPEENPTEEPLALPEGDEKKKR